MTKVFYFFYSLYLWGIIVFTFFLHYLIAPVLVFFFYKESQKGYYDLSVKFLKVAYKLLGIKGLHYMVVIIFKIIKIT